METRKGYIGGCLTRSREQKRLRLVKFIIGKMATGLVRSHLCSFITDSDFCDCFESSAMAKEQVRKVLLAINDDKVLQTFDEFAANLMKTLEKVFFACVSEGRPCRSKSVQKEKVWSEFHKVRIGELPKLWRDLCGKHEELPRLSPLVCQYVNQRLFASIIKSHLSQNSQSCPRSIDVPQLTTDEESIIRYAAGYVPFKLLKKYEKSSSDVAVSAVECLSSMAINGEESSLLEYTTQWTTLVNRGGLYEINDATYMLFRDIEMKVRTHLFTMFRTSTSSMEDRRETVIKSVSNDTDVQFHWSMVSVDIADEQHAIQLLKEIIGLWVTIRGFSIAGAWLEEYKQASHSSVRKSKPLRKGLKQNSQSSE